MVHSTNLIYFEFNKVRILIQTCERIVVSLTQTYFGSQSSIVK